MIDDIRLLVECESPSDDAEALARSADLVARVGRARLGSDPDRVACDGRDHLVWRLGRGPRRVLLLGHHDTVWPMGTLERLPFSAEGAVLRGPGCFDMKTGIIQIFHALQVLTDADGPPAVDGVTVLITADEEIGSPSSRGLIEQEADGCSAALVLESAGPGGALKAERKGVSLYRVRVTGRAAHAGLEPENGVNAGVELAHQILAIAALNDPVSGTTVTPTASHAGTTTNTVPAEAYIAVDVRASSEAEQQRVDRALRALRPTLKGASLSIAGGPNRPPLTHVQSDDLAALARSLAPFCGIPALRTVSVGGGSDGNFTAGIGIPTLDGLGAVGDGAHADHEQVHTEHLASRTALLALMTRSLLRPSAVAPEEMRDARP
ncbi:M20 family metallopeptidase [Leekyejoonella antrihumi]|uniref:M20 family metallopeptidase n=2 Tax=Leekyejoonella antrihumi TaxID=1660198 RepID=A0A563DY04_9MICO|nr:M20 family metallopeptidase [Leekyejoonella antrihumi]